MPKVKSPPIKRISYSEELTDIICKAIAEGYSLSAISKGKGMPCLTTIFDWLNKHKEFTDKYARAREEQAELFADEIISIADMELDPQRAKVRIDARKWVAAKLKPKKYGEAKATVNIENNINVHDDWVKSQLKVVGKNKPLLESQE